MPAIADITVADASAANQTYHAVDRSNGNGTWARWVDDASGIMALRPSYSVRFLGDPAGSLMRFATRYVHRFEDPNILGAPGPVMFVNSTCTLPLSVSVADLHNGFVLEANLRASAHIKAILASMSGPT